MYLFTILAALAGFLLSNTTTFVLAKPIISERQLVLPSASYTDCLQKRLADRCVTYGPLVTIKPCLNQIMDDCESQAGPDQDKQVLHIRGEIRNKDFWQCVGRVNEVCPIPKFGAKACLEYSRIHCKDKAEVDGTGRPINPGMLNTIIQGST